MGEDDSNMPEHVASTIVECAQKLNWDGDDLNGALKYLADFYSVDEERGLQFKPKEASWVNHYDSLRMNQTVSYR